MRVHSLRPVDVIPLAAFARSAGGTEITAHTWPRVEPGSAHLPYFSLASSALTQRPGRRRAWVVRQGRSIGGLVVARARAGGLAWDVEHLHAADELDDVAAQLLERLAGYAASRGARRVFLETPRDGRGAVVARRAAFQRYASTTLCYLPARSSVGRTDVFEARPRLRADEQGLFQLYLAAVPSAVRSAEALTLEEWRGLHRGGRRWQPSLGGSHQQYVWELGASLVGWMETTFGQRSQYVELLIHPRYEEATDRFVRYALQQVSPKAPVYASVREYQPALLGALQQAGFQGGACHDLHVKMLAARVPQARLVPAGVVGG